MGNNLKSSRASRLLAVGAGTLLVGIVGFLFWYAVWGIWDIDHDHLHKVNGDLTTGAGAVVGGTRTACAATVAGLAAAVTVYYTRRGH
ncbi:hypothetical protein ACFVHS_37305 [Streptomyces sp. NPDC057746]|uniref:hypothetical protein n=1 Tax=Streptomyces sp. NPDC057746 TaxID=3346237 RepID=UPI0036B919F1